LVLAAPGTGAGNIQEFCPADSQVVRVEDFAHVVSLFQGHHIDGIFADVHDPAVRVWAGSLLRSKQVLDALPDGVAIVNTDLKILWANPTFERWAGSPVGGRTFYDALGSPELLGPDYNPFHTALTDRTVVTRLHTRDNRYLDLHVTPAYEPGGKVGRLIGVVREVTAQVQQQQKLDALHRAGRELAALSPDQLAEMSVEERIELLKLNIRRFTRDLLHYDVVEVRLLDRTTGRLEVLLQEGMVPEAAQRVLYARVEGNGVTGYVAATGKSYVCPDTAADPHYLEGAAGARSSLTVPLLVGDEVIGTFNVESPRLDAFHEADVQFAEIFGRELASALHTLELLTAEKHSTATQSVEAVSREVALPVDEILTAATTVLDRYIGHDAEMADKLKTILTAARALKQCIQRVGENLAPGARPGALDGDAHPRLRGIRVLVADNDERVRRSAHGILGRFGCVVETARDGQEALTMARLSAYDAVLVDIRLPDVGGYEMYQRLRQAQPRARVIFMTAYGYDASHSIVKARQEGLRFVLYKPFRIDQLLQALESQDEAATAAAGPGVLRA
jgi:CheY-like chemotaxis protein/GAF domain-containing protein